jgi:hypothetical protein
MNQRYARIEGCSNIVRDLKTNAIINTDIQGMQSYLSSKKRRMQEKEKIDSVINDVNDLKSSMEEIKLLLRSLLNES